MGERDDAALRNVRLLYGIRPLRRSPEQRGAGDHRGKGEEITSRITQHKERAERLALLFFRITR